ncbi:predicted protein [Chaetomium globosum CBS 148.51]|uniref:Uncharacterized protein n=1 Tax=Chaetomium globosum (strain ATCC 6205 / CBS 148.51 / DSM 1962 / NBRC 6347 / NRRL 1970) TaxID=306901 RepID=Q2HFR5_CHAGB|nr:uncharacterized protein CHGG_00939 [Chaetomium globosum CBS 148.51]EAQ92704.1 predicted protein [Chaetomium globosum CBS 148.51]
MPPGQEVNPLLPVGALDCRLIAPALSLPQRYSIKATGHVSLNCVGQRGCALPARPPSIVGSPEAPHAYYPPRLAIIDHPWQDRFVISHHNKRQTAATEIFKLLRPQTCAPDGPDFQAITGTSNERPRQITRKVAQGLPKTVPAGSPCSANPRPPRSVPKIRGVSRAFDAATGLAFALLFHCSHHSVRPVVRCSNLFT